MRRPLQRETVAAEYSVPGRNDLHDCRNGRRIHEGMCWGAAAREKNGATTSKTKTVTTKPKTRFPNIPQHWPKKPYRALAIGVRKKIRQEALDKKSSFREVAHRGVPKNLAAHLVSQRLT